jgi:hypothetical protein
MRGAEGDSFFFSETAFGTRINPFYLPRVNALRSHGEKRSYSLGVLQTNMECTRPGIERGFGIVKVEKRIVSHVGDTVSLREGHRGA